MGANFQRIFYRSQPVTRVPELDTNLSHGYRNLTLYGRIFAEPSWSGS